ncbi:MAG: hypothetical protein MUP11_05735, partial [Anaerolineales bacterium]|nr:hypothetical protein [Anaerolineales bacterium]
GGRDLSSKVGGVTARMGLDLLDRDQDTRVIVLVSKPPAKDAADAILTYARTLSKPVVVNFIGYPTTLQKIDNLQFTSTFDDTAAAAVALAAGFEESESVSDIQLEGFAPSQRYLRGLFSGGTLAYEALLILPFYLGDVYSNAPIDKEYRLENTLASQEHTIVDLGEDEFTVGRLHPMMDNELRIKRLELEADDPEVALILMDVVLGHGSHPDPASELAPAIAAARKKAGETGRRLDVVLIISGTDLDPQDMASQGEELKKAGAVVFQSSDRAVRYAGNLVRALTADSPAPLVSDFKPVDLSSLQGNFAAINVGLESFTESLKFQGAGAIQVDWKPAAGGNTDLAALLEKMKS